MSKNVVCTICSREKTETVRLLPARERYLGKHIAAVGTIAAAQNEQFFVLSAEYGFISADEETKMYDRVLRRDEVPTFAQKVQGQLKAQGVAQISFYTKPKPNWQPYLEALVLAAQDAHVELCVHYFSDEV